MTWADYLTDRLVSILCFVVAEGLIFALLWLIDVPGVFISFVLGILLIFFVAALGWDLQRRRRYYGRLLQLLASLDEKTLLMEIAERPNFVDGQIVSEILRTSCKFMNDRLAAVEGEARDYREFLDTWVHEIKNPIASARWIIENEKTPLTLRIDDELRKIDQLVELVLYYTRSSAVEKDFALTRTSLQALVSAALRTYAKAIIQAGGRVEMTGLEVPVRADVKSCVFIIGQILSNAIKYRNENFCLMFSAKMEANGVTLCIHDNGIGIAAADLPRVFDKGFTGENGRRFPQATGIGLYLCKRLCTQMNMGIAITSTAGTGTTVVLRFPTESLIDKTGI